MFTWIDLLIVSGITFLLTGMFTMLVMALMIASGNEKKEAEAYKSGFQAGRDSILKEQKKGE